jgi:hypothetical protein
MDNKNAECVKVCIRIRPMNNKENQENEEEIVTCDSERGEIYLRNPEDQKKQMLFTFDNVFGKNSTQQSIFDTCGKSIVESLLSGFNCTIFAYGQTGTGKTYTMDGIEGRPDKLGIIPRSFSQIFSTIKNSPENVDYLVRASMYELYNEELIDSFNKSEKKEKLEIHEDPKSGFYVKNLSILNIKEEKELLELLSYGKSTRKVRATAMNDYSSRSHSIFTIIVESSEIDQSTGQTHFKIGKLNLVDLAGSEKQKQTKTSDDGLKEGININLSLTTLGNVINLLVKGSPHVPYRNSKLTKLLSDSLGGNSKTLMLANVGPAKSNYAESLQAIKYASRAKMIQNKPKINEDAKDALLRQKQDELRNLREQIERLAMGYPAITENGKLANGACGTKRETKGTPAETEKELCERLKRMESLKNEHKEISKEKEGLQRELENIQNKLRKEEVDRQSLVEKYNNMYKDIISKHDYDEELNQAMAELRKLKSDTTEKANFIETQKMLKKKKQEVDEIDSKSKKIQQQIATLNQTLSKMREEMSFFKQNKQELGMTLSKNIEELQQGIQNSKIMLKKQGFFLTFLISNGFQKLSCCTDDKTGESVRHVMPAYSIHQLRKPLSSIGYNIKFSYQNPYIKEISLKQKTFNYPSEASLYDDGFVKRKHRLRQFRYRGP